MTDQLSTHAALLCEWGWRAEHWWGGGVDPPGGLFLPASSIWQGKGGGVGSFSVQQGESPETREGEGMQPWCAWGTPCPG